MRATTNRLLLVAAIAAMLGCTSVTDAPPAGQVAAAPTTGTGTVQINGLSNFQRTAQVLTVSCSKVKFDTDRRTVAQAAIDNALEGYGAAMPGGLRVDIDSLSLRMRCHEDGPAGFESYCVADARLAVTASGRDRNGQTLSVAASKDVAERVRATVLCVNAMPAVTAAVDKVLADALVDLQSGLTARTGIPAR